MGAIDLQFVRDQLDWLEFLRLKGPLGAQEQAIYEALCQKERRLMEEIAWSSL